MLDMGFIHDIRRVLRLLPCERQNLLFSATYSKEIAQLANGLLHNPLRIEVARRNTAAETVAQLVHPVGQRHKRELLAHLIHAGDWRQVLVFTRTKHGANRLAQQLEGERITAAAIHGNKSQNARTRALADFKRGAVRVLVATDIAARGLDIDGLPHVVNFELPNVPEDYVHRIGRTGRAGADGTAVSLVSADERGLLAGIERVLGRRIPVESIPGFYAADERSEPDAERPSSVRRAQPGQQQRRHHQRPRGERREGAAAVPGLGDGSAHHRPRGRRGADGGNRRKPGI
jgi:ATP-dependent RNA helicase RhlE